MAMENSARYYIRFAEKLLQDTRLLDADARFAESGGRILMAADFSEIYAYCFSASDAFISTQGGELGKNVDERALLTELHDAIMLFFLFESGEPLWLLDPYLLELESFINHRASAEFRETTTLIGEALRQISVAENSEAFAELKDIAERLSRTHLAPAAEDVRRAYEFVEACAPAIVQVAKDKTGRPTDRLNRLLSEGRLLIPSDIPPEIEEGDRETYHRWYWKLSKSRKDRDAQNASDAEAIAIVFRLNRWLLSQERPRRLILLTRSERMHQIMREEVIEGLWADAGGNALRHPRIVLSLLDENAEIVRTSEPSRQLKVIKKWRSTFEPILSANAEYDRRVGSLTQQEITNRHLAVIVDVWRRYCAANAAKLAIDNEYILQYAGMRAIRILLDPQQIKTAVRARLDELDFFLGSSNFVFATMMSSELSVERRIRADPLSRGTHTHSDSVVYSEGGLVQIRNAHGTPMSFRIKMRDARLTNVLVQDANDPWLAFSSVSQDNMLEPRTDVSEADFEVEWYVAMGYICAAIGAWKATRRACDSIRRLRTELLGEAQLLLARATRHLSEDLDTLMEMACKLEIVLASAEGSDDVRFMSECVKYDFIILRRSLDLGRDEVAIARYAKILAHWPAARSRALMRETTPEACELTNNLLYHSAQLIIKQRPVQDWFGVKEMFEHFQWQLGMVYNERAGWPDNFVDTYGWVRLQLLKNGKIADGGVTTDFDFEISEVLGALESVGSRQHTSDVDISDFRLHKDEATNYFAKIQSSKKMRGINEPGR